MNGSKEGAEQALTEQKAKVHTGMAPNSAFQRVYGIPGFYLADTSAKLEGIPLITVSSSNFLGLIARQKLSYDATDQEVDAMKGEFSSKYLLASGMSVEKVAALKQAFAADQAADKRED